MPSEDDFPKSVILHFPPSVYQKHGAAEMIPKLLEILCVEDLRCIQFLRNGKVRVSFREKDKRDHYLVEGLRFGDLDIPVTKDGQKVTVLHIRDLPYEVASDDLVEFFSNYGEVLTVERSVAANFPALCNGNRILKLILNEDLPYFLSVCGFQCRVWYRGQPLQCLVCRQRGHRAQSCPLSGRCRYCHQVGHMARDCAQAWDPPPVVSVDPDVDVSSASSSATVVEDPPDKSSAPVRETANYSSDPEPPSISPVDNLPDPEPSKVTSDVPMPASASKPSRPAVTAKTFCARLSKNFKPLKFPDFGNASDKDSKAKAHLRTQIKDMDVLNSDLRKWSEGDLGEISSLLCKMLSVPDHLVDYVSGMLKATWNTVKSKTLHK